MKRFKDCLLLSNEGQTPQELLQLVKDECGKTGFKAAFNDGLSGNDTLCVSVDFDGLPVSNVVLYASKDKKGVDIINIIPYPRSGVSRLEIPVYNRILDAFKNKIFCVVAEKDGNKIEENTEDYTIEEIIPKSFFKLSVWLSQFPLSHHPNDEHRWYDFLIALLKNGEYVSTDVLSEYIEENYHWSENDLHDMELKYEGQMDLLEYYEERR